MIKINKKNIHYGLLLSLLCLTNSAYSAETESDVFKKVFGAKEQIRYVSLPLFFKDKFLTEVYVGVLGEKIVNYSGSTLIPALKLILVDSEINRLIKLKKDKFENSDLNFKVEYFPSDLKLDLIASNELIKPNESLFQDDLIPYFAADAIRPSPFGGAINWKLEKSFSIHDSEPTYTGINLNSFFNFKSFVLENSTQYLSNYHPYWYRGNTTIVKDDEKNLIRYSLGDTGNSTQGYLVGRNIGGISISRDFGINPYRMSTPTSNTEFTIENRSLVRYYINNALIKSEYLVPGKYSVKNIPLNNGINNIIVEVENEFGEKKVFNFRESFSTELLRAGDFKFDFTSGYVSNELNNKKVYETDKGIATSLFYKRGYTNHYTNTFYEQHRDRFNLLGTENVFASKVGNWILGVGNSDHADNNGFALNVGYSLSFYSNFLNNTQNLNVRLETRQKKFSDSFEYSPSRFKFNANTSYSIPVSEIASLGIGTQYSKPYDNSLFEKYGMDLSLTGRLIGSSTITLFSSIIRDEYKSWNQYFYFFVNISFPSQATYVSTYYESQSQAKKVNIFHDRGEVINDLKVQASIEDSRYADQADLDLQYNTKLADFGSLSTVKKSNGVTSGRTNLRMLSSVLFGSSGSGINFGISRPTPNSFALFVPDKKLIGQKIKVKSLGSSDQSESGLGGRFAVNDLIPYQYRRIQLDPTNLLEGYTLTKESYIVFPTYKSAHIIDVNSLGTVALRGKLVDNYGVPLKLKVGTIILNDGTELPFFTNKNGKFFIESIKAGLIKFKIEDENFKLFEFNVDENKNGIIELGEIKIEALK